MDSLPGGGAEKVFIHLLKQINRDLFDVEVMILVKTGIYIPEIPSDIPRKYVFGDGVKMKALGLFPLFRLYRRLGMIFFRKYPRLVSRLIQLDKYDLGISFCQGDNTILLDEKKKHFEKRIVWIHTDLSYQLHGKQGFDFWNKMKNVDRLFFVSEDAKKSFLKHFSNDTSLADRSKIVYNPIDMTTIKKEATSTMVKRQKENPQLIGIGRLAYEKGFDCLINIHKRLIEEGIDHEVIILGIGPLEAQLTKQIQALNVQKTCKLLGFQNPYPYLQAADIFVSSSRREGFSLVVAEAMVLCKPIVSTKSVGPVELLEDGKYGLLTENNEESLYQGIKEMLTNPELRKHYNNLLASNQDNFVFKSDIGNIEQALLELYEQ